MTNNEDNHSIDTIETNQFATPRKSLDEDFVIYEFKSESDFFLHNDSPANFLRKEQYAKIKSTRLFSLTSKTRGHIALFYCANATLEHVSRSKTFIGSLPHQCHIGRFLLSQGFHLGEFLYEFCAIEYDDGKFHFFDTKVDRLVSKYGCSIHSTSPILLPDFIRTNGDFFLIDTEIEQCPTSMHVEGDLILRGAKNLQLPKKLAVTGDLGIEGSDATKLYASFSVGRDLNISHSEMKNLPKNFDVGRHIIAIKSKIVKLPDMLHVRGNLNLKGSSLRELPEGLKVDGNLDITDTNITRVPMGTIVKGRLFSSRNVDIPPMTEIGQASATSKLPSPL